MTKQGPERIAYLDWTWNPIAMLCEPVSAGCANCWARRRLRMLAGNPNLDARTRSAYADALAGKPSLMEWRLDEPYKVRKPARIGVQFMADLGHGTAQLAWRLAVAEAMRRAPWHAYMVLTKRPGPWLRELPPECWVGVTIEIQKHSIRWTQLLGWSWPGAPVRFVSVEPMLGPVTFAWAVDVTRPDWVIAGPETGPKALWCDDAWIEALAAESPCFFDKRDQWTRREFPS